MLFQIYKRLYFIRFLINLAVCMKTVIFSCWYILSFKELSKACSGQSLITNRIKQTEINREKYTFYFYIYPVQSQMNVFLNL